MTDKPVAPDGAKTSSKKSKSRRKAAEAERSRADMPEVDGVEDVAIEDELKTADSDKVEADVSEAEEKVRDQDPDFDENSGDVAEKEGDEEEQKEPRDWKKFILGELRFFAGLFAFLLLFYTTIFGHFKIPSESMQPTLEVGDHLYVSKFAYGHSRHSIPLGLHKLPFLPDGKIFSRVPNRGDVAVFRHPISGLVMIKRVVGLPGDEIQLRGGRVFLNGQMIDRTPIDNYLYRQDANDVIVGVDVYEEQWPDEDKPHIIYEQSDFGLWDKVGPFIVPQGHLFMMGDNRDNSIDSRAPGGPGMVPFDHLIGRADLMMFSFKRCKKERDLYCPPRRFLKRL